MKSVAGDRLLKELGENEHHRFEACPPNQADLDLADRLMVDESNPKVVVRWLVNGTVDVTTTSYIGTVRFSRLDLHVVAKLAGGALPVLRMIEYASGVDLLKRLNALAPMPAADADLFDLICLLLAEEAGFLVRDGLLQDYRVEDDTLDVLRGRLRVRDQWLKRFGRLDKLECQFDEYDADIPENQLIAAALRAARARTTGGELRARLGRLASIFSEACLAPSSDPDWYERVIQYGRRNERYRAAHELAKLVLRGLSFSGFFDPEGTSVSAFLIDMNKVFEKFVTRLVSDALATTPFCVYEQHKLKATIRDDRTDRSYATIRPDLVIKGPVGDNRVPLDVKYKQYDLKKVSTSDIYQSFLYGYALQRDSNDRRSGILYASDGDKPGTRLSIRSAGGEVGGRFVAAGLNIPAALAALAGPGREPMLAKVRTLLADMTGLSI